jgi:predicted DNA-binding transcriptional regulator YafY
MMKRTGGTKRSSWLTFCRRLLLVRLLLRAPMCSVNLITAVRTELGDEGYPEAAASALKHDLDALKSEFGCQIRFQRSTGCYVLDDLGDLALLDLPDSCMEALAFLEASFPAGAVLPEHAHIRDLLDRMLRLLPGARQKQLRQRRNLVELQLLGEPPGKIDETVLETVKRAITQRRELIFSYLSLFDHDQPRQHRVAPYGIFFRPEGHGYLDAMLIEASPPGQEPRHAAINYRLDRILPGSVKILPQVLPPQRIAPPTYRIRYRLLPQVARRRDVAAYFPETEIIYHDDGSATVTATVTNLWQARQILLRYGTACIVEEPVELVSLFRQTAQGLAELYGMVGKHDGS